MNNETNYTNQTIDRAIEEVARRRQGAFYTPQLWVEEAHLEIEKVLGNDWKEECIVWDCCAGSGNLTRDYDFDDLILSSLTDIEVEILEEEQGDKALVKQLDFLNDLIPDQIDLRLKTASSAGKRLVFLINPPYATAGIKGEESRAGVANTLVNKEMKKAKLGACSQQLYTQFLFQCEQIVSDYGFKNKSMGVFCNPAFMTSSSFAKFRPFWYERYSYQSGFMFQASHFAGVKGSWGVSFTLWNEGNTDINQNLPLTLKDQEDGSIISLGTKTLYVSDNREASAWVREPARDFKTFDAPQMASGLNIKTEGTMRGRQAKESLMYATLKSNNIMSALEFTFLTSSCSAQGNGGCSVLAGESWRRAIALYSARKLVKGDWINDKDEYLIPQTELEGYDQWVDDCHVYALLHASNNMTAMRNVDYKQKKYNIHNHFFWLTRKQAIELYGSNRETRSLYRDVKKNPIPFIPEVQDNVDVTPEWRKNGDPYFSFVLPNLNLSPLAVEILKDLNGLFIESLPLRKQVTHLNSLNLHLDAWDAGIYQLKKFWYTNPQFKEKWEALRVKHLRLAKQLKPGIYKYGFLK